MRCPALRSVLALLIVYKRPVQVDSDALEEETALRRLERYQRRLVKDE
jgi:hypothetical protein